MYMYIPETALYNGTTYCYLTWPLFGHRDLSSDAVNRPGCSGGIYGPSAASVAPTFPPCRGGFYHLPWRDTPASSGIRAGLRRLGLTQRHPGFAAPENWVETLRRKQELGELGSLNTAVAAALWGSAGWPVSTAKQRDEPNIRPRLFQNNDPSSRTAVTVWNVKFPLSSSSRFIVTICSYSVYLIQCW